MSSNCRRFLFTAFDSTSLDELLPVALEEGQEDFFGSSLESVAEVLVHVEVVLELLTVREQQLGGRGGRGPISNGSFR